MLPQCVFPEVEPESGVLMLTVYSDDSLNKASRETGKEARPGMKQASGTPHHPSVRRNVGCYAIQTVQHKSP